MRIQFEPPHSHKSVFLSLFVFCLRGSDTNQRCALRSQCKDMGRRIGCRVSSGIHIFCSHMIMSSTSPTRIAPVVFTLLTLLLRHESADKARTTANMTQNVIYFKSDLMMVCASQSHPLFSLLHFHLFNAINIKGTRTNFAFFSHVRRPQLKSIRSFFFRYLTFFLRFFFRAQQKPERKSFRHSVNALRGLTR